MGWLRAAAFAAALALAVGAGAARADERTSERERERRALREIEPLAAAAPVQRARLLELLLRDPSEGVRSAAANALTRDPTGAEPAVPEIARALAEAPVAVRHSILEMLKAPGWSDPRLIDALGHALGSPDLSVRSRALEALRTNPASTPAVIEGLIGLLADSSRRRESCARLEARGRAAAPAQTALLQLLAARNFPGLRQAAALALAASAPLSPAARSALQESLKDPDQGVRTAAAGALAKDGPATAQLMNVLDAGLSAAEPSTAAAAATLVVALDAASDARCGAMLRALGAASDDEVRRRLYAALRSLDRRCEPAVWIALSDPDSDVSERARSVLDALERIPLRYDKRLNPASRPGAAAPNDRD